MRRTPGAEGRQEQVLSRGSSCNPSTTDQELAAVSDPNLTPLVQQQSSSLENTSQQGSQESPERVQSETPKLHPSPKDNYIKTEPVSPVPMCPKRRVKRSLLQASHSGESIDIDVDARSHNDNAPERSQTVQPQVNADIPKHDSPPENMGNRRPLIQGGRNGTGATERKGESVLRGLLRRQRTIEDMDAEVQSDPHEGMSPPQGAPNMPRSMSLSDTPTLSPRNSALPRQSSEPIVRQTESHDESEEAKKPESESPESVETIRTETASRGILRDMEACTAAKIDRRSDQGHRRSTDILRKTGSIDETSSGQPAPRGCRQRSYSLTEGDVRLPPDAISTDFRANQPAEANVEKEQPRFPMYRPQEHQRMPYWPRGFPGLIHQPFAVDNDPRKMWHSLPTYQSQGSVQSEPPVPSRPTSEHGKSLLPTQMSEDSFLRHPGMGPRRKRNPAALSNQHSADGVAPMWMGHNQYAEGGRAPMMGSPWHHLHRGMPHHMLIRQNADDKSASPSITSSTSHRHIPMYPSLERSASQSGPGEMPNFERRRPPMLGHVGASSESSQELPPTEDITRQVHRAISGTGLYAERAAISWSDQSSGNNTSMEEQSGKDIDFKKRSRKSTFNIYREIPERKRKLDRDEEERIKSSYNPDGSFDYFSLTGWKAYKCDLCKKRRFKTLSELEEHKRRKHALQHTHIGNASSSSSSGIGASLDDGSSSPQLTPQLSNG